MFIWMAKFGAAYGVRTGIHVGVDVLVNLLPPASRKQVIVFSLLCGALFTGVVAVFGGSFVDQMYVTGQHSNDLEAPMWVIYLTLPLGSGLMCFRFLQVAWWFYWTGQLPHHDVAHVEGRRRPAASGRNTARWLRKSAGMRPLGLILILAPLLIVAICVAHATGLIVLPQGMRAVIMFVLLIALMLTGMPVSISLGLTVLTFMFTLTDVRTESVALKLFTGLESFEIMAIPFFILAGNFLTHGGVARRMIAFATAMVGHWYGGLALAGVLACALFAAVSGSSPATVVAIGSVILPAMVAQGFPEAVRCRRHHHVRFARNFDTAVYSDGALRGRHQFIGRKTVHRRHCSRHHAGDDAGRDDLLSRLAQQLSAYAPGIVRRTRAHVPRIRSGACS